MQDRETQIQIFETKDYDKFKFRSDNRSKINLNHVKNLEYRISESNYLSLNPIHVNRDMEVLNGQHRLLAAKTLGVPIYYCFIDDMTAEYLLASNYSRSWKSVDYLNYYYIQGREEYVKLKNFIDNEGISLDTAIMMTGGRQSGDQRDNFRRGKYKFSLESASGNAKNVRNSIEIIEKVCGKKSFLVSKRFCSALLMLFNSEEFFDFEIFFKRLEMLANRLSAKASVNEYLDSLKFIYEFRSRKNPSAGRSPVTYE